MKDGIDWTEVGAGGRFEKIVSTLLSTMYPESERIDGAGGDGGRDHQLCSADRLDLWQSKYFLRRLSESPSRKGQVTESLRTAARLRPDSWTLVTPMVPTPGERAWFDDLAREYPFPVVWRGGDWLDAQLAMHPAIVRHFMSANDEYVALLRELKEEQEALVDGLPAATSRIERLAEKLNDSNPFYAIDFTVQDGRVTNTHLRAKYRGAEQDSPVTMQFTVVAGSAQADLMERLRSAFEWGDQAELPAEHVRNVIVTGPPGFGGAHDSADIVIGPAPQEHVDLSMRIVIHSPEGRQLVALPARCTTRVAGTRGVTLHGIDFAGVVEAHLRVAPEERSFTVNLTCTWSRPLLPGAILPIVRFLRHAEPPNTVSLTIAETITTNQAAMPSTLAVPEEVVQFVEGMERLQAAAGEPFPMPTRWTITDMQQVRRAVRLLDGHRVTQPGGSVTLEAINTQRILDAFEQKPASLRMSTGESYVVRVADHDLDLGPYMVYIPKAELHQGSGHNAHMFTVLPEPGSDIEIELGVPPLDMEPPTARHDTTPKSHGDS